MRRSSLFLALVAAICASCAPTCDQTCRKLIRCAESGSTETRVECDDACIDLLQELDDVEDKAREELFAAHRRCIVGATCDEIDAGECYDETLFAF